MKSIKILHGFFITPARLSSFCFARIRVWIELASKESIM